MPDYKKRKRSRFSSPKRVKKSRIATNKTSSDINMTPSYKKRNVKADSNMKVVKGRKIEKKQHFRSTALITAGLILAILVVNYLLPAGIIESISVATAVIGTGSHPIELSSTDTVNTVSKGSYYYVLSNTNLDAFTNSGKHLLRFTHGYEKPVLKTSASRALIFEQGGKEALIFSLKKLKTTVKTEKSIITAAVSDSGRYAIATHSDKYASMVTVYSKNGDVIYEWYSAKNMVNNVALSSNGKKIAVSTLDSSGGQYTAELNVLNFNSATPEHTEVFQNTFVYNIDSSFRNSFAVVTGNSTKFIKWHNYKAKEYKSEYTTAFFRAGKGRFVAVYNRESDKTDNKIVLFSATGKIVAEFNYNGIISDIAVSGSHIYCMSDTEIFLLDTEGKVLRKGNCGFGAVRFNVASTNSVLVITDNRIDKLNLE